MRPGFFASAYGRGHPRMIPIEAFAPMVSHTKGVSKGAPLSIALLPLSRVRSHGLGGWEPQAYQRGPSSSRLMRTARFTWALSTKPNPIIIVTIEVPPYETSGSGTPTTGTSPVTIATLMKT
jgi:hypothetical protein